MATKDPNDQNNLPDSKGSRRTVVVDNLRLQVEYIHSQRDSFSEMSLFER